MAGVLVLTVMGINDKKYTVLINSELKVKTRKRKEAEVRLSRENYEWLKKIAMKNGLKLEQVVNAILLCELDIIEYVAWKRLKLLKRLKIELTTKRLYHHTL